MLIDKQHELQSLLGSTKQTDDQTKSPELVHESMMLLHIINIETNRKC